MRPWLLETAAMTTLLLLTVLIARTVIRHWFGPRSAYLLWALPVLRSLLPPLPAPLAPAPLMIEPMSEVHAGVSESLPLAAGSWTGMAVVYSVWFGGAALFLLVQAIRYASFLCRYMPSRSALHRAGGILFGVAAVEGPLAGGVFRRFVLVPPDFAARYSSEQRRLVLRHEVTHHCRLDIAANAVATIMLAIYWWDPVAHLAYRAFRDDQERACDADVLAGRSPSQRRAYAEALVLAVDSTALPVCTWRGRNGLAGRLRGIAALPARRQRSLDRLPAILLIVSGLALTAQSTPIREAGSHAVSRLRQRIESAAPPLAVLGRSEAGIVRRSAVSRPTFRAAMPRPVADEPRAVLVPADDVLACPADAPPGNDCERERSRRRSLSIQRASVAADETLPPEQRAFMLHDMDEEMIHPRQSFEGLLPG